MGDVGIESTLVLDGLAVSKVRFYSTLDSDVGKRVEITDKFNPLNVFTGTFDESLNLLYDLPAFTSYQVKMYGLDGDTVESDQSFMLKGYDYLEKNVGLNKNSFAGIKAIVDQGLESTMLHVGDEFSEDDNFGDDGGRWIILAINHDPQVQGYRHSVYLARKYIPNATPLITGNDIGNSGYMLKSTNPVLQAEDSFYEGMPASMKNAITERKIDAYAGDCLDGAGRYITANRHVWHPSIVEYRGAITQQWAPSGTFQVTVKSNDVAGHSRFEYCLNNVLPTKKKDGTGATAIFCSSLASPYAGNYYMLSAETNTASGNYTYGYANSQQSIGVNFRPHVMIASDPI